MVKRTVQWDGAKYARKKSGTWRDGNNGNVYNSRGIVIGIEKTGDHVSGKDGAFPFRAGLRKPKMKSKVKVNKIK